MPSRTRSSPARRSATVSRRPSGSATTDVDAAHRQRSLARQQRCAEHDRRRLHHRCPARRVDPARLLQEQPRRRHGVEGAAHQSAIWQLTNPSSPQLDQDHRQLEPTSRPRPRARPSSLADSATNFASVNNTADLSVDGGADLQTCAGTSRTVTVTGSPWTDASLTLSGAGVLPHGAARPTTVNLGATGTAQVQVDSTGPGQVDVTANVKIATMVQADNGGNQDFVYLEFQTVSEAGLDRLQRTARTCTLSKTAIPAFDRARTTGRSRSRSTRRP